MKVPESILKLLTPVAVAGGLACAAGQLASAEAVSPAETGHSLSGVPA